MDSKDITPAGYRAMIMFIIAEGTSLVNIGLTAEQAFYVMMGKAWLESSDFEMNQQGLLWTYQNKSKHPGIDPKEWEEFRTIFLAGKTTMDVSLQTADTKEAIQHFSTKWKGYISKIMEET